MEGLDKFIQAALTNTVLLLPFIMAIVTWSGQAFGVAGRAKFIVSMLVGFVFGVSAQIAVIGAPSAFADYFVLFLFGLAPGLTASGVFEVGKDLSNRVAAQAANTRKE